MERTSQIENESILIGIMVYACVSEKQEMDIGWN